MEDEMGRACSTHGAMWIVYRVFIGNPSGKRPLGSPRRRWDDNIKINFREIGWCGMD
jgi:hypothetical protein